MPETSSEIEPARSDSLARKDIDWTHGPVGGVLREGLGRLVFDPLLRIYTHRQVTGQENLEGLDGPIIFVANHASHLDTPAILRSLPRPWRRRTVVGAAADYFYKGKLRATAVSIAFNTVPIERRSRRNGSGQLDHIDRMLEEGSCLLLFPEGTRRTSDTGGRVRRGAAAIAARHDAFIVPIYLEGTGRAFPPGRLWFRGVLPFKRHSVTVHIGKPIPPTPPEEETVSITQRITHFFETRRSGERKRDRLLRRRHESPAEEPPAQPAGDGGPGVGR